jgi:superfamily II DNA or RNA helicase
VLAVTGDLSQKDKEHALNLFKSGHLHALVGTATLATGTDGLDKVCHTLIIVDDTDDDALRRQLIGRIMHRGAGQATSQKKILRFKHLALPTP